MDERRQYIRIDKSTAVSYRVLEQFLGSGSRSKNISEGGICLPLHQRFGVGVVLELKIHLAELSQPILAIGKVVWLEEKKEDVNFPFELGIQFIKISPADKNKIITHISNNRSTGIRPLE